MSSAPRLPTGDADLGRAIATRRKSMKLTQDALAAKAGHGLTKANISQYEKGITMPPVPILRALGEAMECGVDLLLFGASAAKFQQQVLPGMALDDRINALPEGLREFVLLSLQRAEHARTRIPTQFLKPPTSENWPQFAAYLEAISLINHEKDGQ